MTDQSVIVWDLETITDLDAVARMLDMKGASEEQLRTAVGGDFPKHPLHKIVCIGALIASRRSDGWQIDALGAPNIADRSEAELIRAFVEKIRELRPQLITFNGNSFDLPVLRYRAMINRISADGLQVRPYFHRFTDDALDLCDVLASHSSAARVKLDEITKILGFPGKPAGIDGSQVDSMVSEGKISAVSDYCESDVVNTYRVWLSYELFRGTISPLQLEWSEKNMREFIIERKRSNPHLLGAVGASADAQAATSC